MEINCIRGGPHIVDSSRESKEKFTRSLKHEYRKICFIVVEVNPAKLPKIIAEEITFGDRYCIGTSYLHTGAMVIKARIEQAKMNQILIDNGISISLLYKVSFDKMNLYEKDMHPCTSALCGLSEER